MYFQLPESAVKVEGWLFQQDASYTPKSSGKDQTIELVKTLSLHHIEPEKGKVNMSNRFTVSESGAIGISCNENPSLSVMYPDTGKAPVILSSDTIYRSATFVKIGGKEYLAAACQEDGCLHLWDTELKTYRKSFDPKLPMDKRKKSMNICMIDDNTIGYWEVYPSLDESRRVFILKTDTGENWTLSEILKLFTPEDIDDMCHTKMLDGTPCLLLCIPHAHRIMAVDMEDGRTRWEAGEEQMGDTFKPWSICTDQNDCAYVADYGQDKIHLLSASDGTVIKRFDVGGFYGFLHMFYLQFHDQHLYVGQKIPKQKYAIMKFKQIKEM